MRRRAFISTRVKSASMARYWVPLQDAPRVTTAIALAVQALPTVLLATARDMWLRRPIALFCCDPGGIETNTVWCRPHVLHLERQYNLDYFIPRCRSGPCPWPRNGGSDYNHPTSYLPCRLSLRRFSVCFIVREASCSPRLACRGRDRNRSTVLLRRPGRRSFPDGCRSGSTIWICANSRFGTCDRGARRRVSRIQIN